MIETLTFESFGRTCSGRVVTHHGDTVVIYKANPYGSHNLVVVDWKTGEAYRHGTPASVMEAKFSMPEKQYRKVRAFLASRGIGLNWVVD